MGYTGPMVAILSFLLVLDTKHVSGAGSEFNNLLDDTKSGMDKCVAEDGKLGICFSYTLCYKQKGKITTDDIVFVSPYTNCPNAGDVCCPRSVVSSNLRENISNKNPETTAATQKKPRKCGITNARPNSIIFQSLDSNYNDIYVDFGEFPWMVAIYKLTGPNNLKTKQNKERYMGDKSYIGGGSLIHPSVVMTVAHKVTESKPQEIIIRAGEYLQQEKQLYEYQERDVAKIVIHNYFNQSYKHNDIGILFLKNPVILEGVPYIGIGCLGKELPKFKTECYTMSWGTVSFANQIISSEKLKKVKLPLIHRKRCEVLLQKYRHAKNFRLHDSLICAGGKLGIDTCKTDGGSALVCRMDDIGSRFTIIGMVSYGIDCGGKNKPDVFTNIPHLYEWVGLQLSAEGYNADSYVS